MKQKYDKEEVKPVKKHKPKTRPSYGECPYCECDECQYCDCRDCSCANC